MSLFLRKAKIWTGKNSTEGVFVRFWRKDVDPNYRTNTKIDAVQMSKPKEVIYKKFIPNTWVLQKIFQLCFPCQLQQEQILTSKECCIDRWCTTKFCEVANHPLLPLIYIQLQTPSNAQFWTFSWVELAFFSCCRYGRWLLDHAVSLF